jgi:arabinofuranosyltransferase
MRESPVDRLERPARPRRALHGSLAGVTDRLARALSTRAGPSAVAALGAAFLAVCLVGAWPFIVDDTFITLRYSRNVAEGLGPTFNAIGPRAEGYTTLLWMLILVVPHRLGLDAPAFAKGLGVAATLSTCALAARWAWSEAARDAWATAVSPAPRSTRAWAATTAAACLAAIPATAVHAVSGMETALFTLTLTAMFVAAADWVRAAGGARGRWGANRIVACALLAGLTRPEGNLAAFVVVATTAMLVARGEARALVVRAVAGWLLPVAGYELWRRHYYGLTFPLPFYVKLATPGRLPGWPDVVLWLSGPALFFAILLVPTLARPPRSLRPAIAAVLVLAGFFILPQHQMGYEHRYLAPLDPTLAVVAGVGIARLAARGTRVATAIAGTGLAIALGGNAVGAPATIGWVADYGRGLGAAHARLGRELFALDRPASRLVISDAGAAPYFSRWWTLDLIGLNDAHIATTGRPDAAWVMSQHPDVVVLASPRTDRFETWDWNPWETALFDACTAAGFARVAVRRFGPAYWLWVMAPPDSPAARGLTPD